MVRRAPPGPADTAPPKTARSGPSQRQLRVGEELRHALSEVFARGELRDPELQGRTLTVTEVRTSPDLRNATAYVVQLGAEADEPLLRALGRSAPFLRSRLAEMVNLRFSPKLFFAVDRSFESAQRIEKVLRAPEVARDLQSSPESESNSQTKPGEDDDAPA